MTFKVSCDECGAVMSEFDDKYFSECERRIPIKKYLSLKIKVDSSGMNHPHLCYKCALALFVPALMELIK